ncbi:MAG: 5-oxoprolinase (ATP-hydrolyzing) [Microbacteriaceae bacterium]|nr:5-oxoprolinase (ATP-hydrolyzing) [Microbacteriaceae bacterium]
MAGGTEFDSIRTSLMWSKVRAIADEVAGVVVKTAVSTSVGVSEDFGCSVLDARGRLMACGVPSVAQFSALLPRSMRMVLEEYPAETWSPGDVVLTTDPWVAAGHAYDLLLVTPAFRDDQLVAFVVSLAHTSDIGGSLALSGAKDMYEEGLMLPLLKVYKQGVLNEDLIAILRANIRVPDVMMGDFYAMTAANELGARRLVEMLADDGLDDFVGLTDELENYTEAAVRKAISELPDGEYAYEVDSDGLIEPVHLKITITIAGDELKADYTGSDPQRAAQALNAVFNFTFSETVTALQCVLTPTIPFNEGFLRAVDTYAPEGSVFNCTKPMPVKNRDKVISHIETLVFGALYPIMPDRVLAGSAGANVTIFNGRESVKGRPFNAYLSQGGGTGAGVGYDGINALHFPWGSRNIPVELVETRAPVTVVSKELRTDSGGPGQFRGGCGQETVLRVSETQSEDDPIALALYSENVRFPAEGLEGGEAGVIGGYSYNGTDLAPDSKEVLDSFIFLKAGDELRIRLAGGGGYGDAFERDVERVERDVQLGFVSVAAARERYGVVMEASTGHADRAATAELRAARGTAPAE